MATFTQTDTDSDLSAGAGSTGLSLITGAQCHKMGIGSTAGSAEISYTHPAATTTLLYLEAVTDASVLDFYTWGADTVVPITLNVTTYNRDLNLEAVYVERLNSAGASQATIGSTTGIALSLASAGLKSTNVNCAAQTYSAGDRIRIYFAIANTNAKTEALGLTPSGTMVHEGVTDPAWEQTDYRWRNDDGSESAATWAANANIAITAAPGTKRVRVRVTNTGAGVTAFGWQYVTGVIRCDPLASVGEPVLGDIGGSGTYERLGQSFTTGGAITVNKVALPLDKVSSPTDNLYLEIRSGSTTGTLLGTSNAVAASGLGSYAWASFTFASPVALSGSTMYYLVLRRSGNRDTTNYIQWWSLTGNPYADGSYWAKSGGSWTETTTKDLGFNINGSGGWTALPAQDTAGVPIRFDGSSNVTDAGATTEQMGGALTFVAGLIYETAHTSTVTFTGAQETELEAVVEMVSGQVADDDVIQLRVVREV